MRAVLDTNVLISAFANLDGTPGKIYRAWTEAVFELVISEYILDEFRQVAVSKLKFSYGEVTEVLNLFHQIAILIEPVNVTTPGVDANDLPIFGTAVAGGASVIVTGDKKVLKVKRFMGIKTIEPSVFLKIIETTEATVSQE